VSVRRNLVPAAIVGAVMGVAVALGMASLDKRLHAQGDPPPDPLTYAGQGLGLGLGAFWLTWVFLSNKKLALAGSDEERRALAFASDPERGVVYVFRDAYWGRLVGMDILVDGATVAQTRGKTFMRLELAPGDHVLSSSYPYNNTQVDLPVRVAPGAVLYTLQRPRILTSGPGHELLLTEPEPSRRRIRRCRLLALASSPPSSARRALAGS